MDVRFSIVILKIEYGLLKKTRKIMIHFFAGMATFFTALFMIYCWKQVDAIFFAILAGFFAIDTLILFVVAGSKLSKFIKAKLNYKKEIRNENHSRNTRKKKVLE